MDGSGIGTVTATCGSCDWSTNGHKIRCDDRAPYFAQFRCASHDDCGRSYTIPVCERHARNARTDDGLIRVYSA